MKNYTFSGGNTKKSRLFGVFGKICAIFLFILLAGCAKKESPITSINSSIQQSVAELVDYAQNNMDIDTDKQLLLNGVKDCAAKADALTISCKESLDNLSAQKRIVELERNGLVLFIILGLIAMFYVRWRK